MQDGSHMASSHGNDGGGEYHSKPGHLNVLPSRQNVLWDGDHLPKGCLSQAVHFPREPLSLDTPKTMERLLSPQKTTLAGLPELRSRTSSNSEGSHAPLLDKASCDENDKAFLDNDSEELIEGDALSMPEAVFNLANTVLGVGVLSVPYAFRLSGYSTLLLVLITIMVTSGTASFIGAALVLASKSAAAADIPRKGRDFIFLAHVAFGRIGCVVVGIITSAEIWFALVTFMVMNGVNAAIVWPMIRPELAVVVSCVLAALTVFVPMRFFSYLSLISSLSLAGAAAAMIGAALMMPSWANPYDHLGTPALLQLQNVPRSVGIIVFCFAGHPCFPVVHECMRNRKSWNASVAMTFFLAFLYYGGLGVFGYLVFGQGLEASVTMNLAQLRGMALCRVASALFFLVKIQLTAPLLLNAILVSFWAPSTGKKEWPIGRLVSLFLLVFLTALTAIAFSSDVAAVASLTGSLFTMITSVIFPTLVHLRLTFLLGQPKRGYVRAYVPHALILAFGVSMAIAGTFLAMTDMIKKWSGS